MRQLRVRLTIRRLMVVVAAIAVVFALRPQQQRIIDELRSPVAVTGWSDTGLLLADGRSAQLPGIGALPSSSAALIEATRWGVELGSGGRVYGLVRVHHWCGNDRVGEHIARVDLSHLLAFLGEGELVCKLDQKLRTTMAEIPGGRFTAAGWEVGEHTQFRFWSLRVDDQGGSYAAQARRRSRLPRPAISADRAGKSDR